MRTTKKDVELVFERFVKTSGNRIARSWDDVGGWQLDYDSCYGGWQIQVIANSNGGVSLPFGSERFNHSSMCSNLWFAEKALTI